MAKKPIKSPAKKLPAKKVVKVVVAKAKKTVKPAKPVKVVKAAVKSKVLTKAIKVVKTAKKVSKPAVVAKKPLKSAASKKSAPQKSAPNKVVKTAKKITKAVKPVVKKTTAKQVSKVVKAPLKKVTSKVVAKKVDLKKQTKATIVPVKKKPVKVVPKVKAKTVVKVVVAKAKKTVKPAKKAPVALKAAKKPPVAPTKVVQQAPSKPVPQVKKVIAAPTKPVAEKSDTKVSVVKQERAPVDKGVRDGFYSNRPLRPKVPTPADLPVKPVANPIYVPPAPDGKPGIKFAPMAVIEKPKEKSNKSEEEDMSSKTAPRLAFAESDDKKGISVEAKLRALYSIQLIDSRIDKIHAMRGELPLEVKDLEDDVAGLEARLTNLTGDVKNLNEEIIGKKNGIKNSEALIVKYKEQLNNVKNNREYDSLNKEIEFQDLEIQLHNKRIREFEMTHNAKVELHAITEVKLQDRRSDLQLKRAELDDIIASTEKVEKVLRKKSDEAKKLIEERLLNAYERIRSGAPNGMAVVPIEREASAGSFIQLPAQKQLDVASRKRVIVDEHSGRILVDADLALEEQARMEEELSKAVK
jgi:predicted  nucleic acid-binding Zn-ribbon protein